MKHLAGTMQIGDGKMMRILIKETRNMERLQQKAIPQTGSKNVVYLSLLLQTS